MAAPLQVFANEDDVLLYWRVSAPISGCRGFAVSRRATDPSGAVSETVLANRIGFASTTPPQPDAASQTEPSTVWPFQRFSRTDHAGAPGGTLSYQVVPMVRDTTGALVPLSDQASAWSPRKA